SQSQGQRSELSRWVVKRCKHGTIDRSADSASSVTTVLPVLASRMPGRDASKTSVTLLARLASLPPDQAAWCDLGDRYGPRILQWCRAWGLQEADMLDVSQAVLTKLAVQMSRFRYESGGSFRNWLRTLVERATIDLLAARGRVVGRGTAQTS